MPFRITVVDESKSVVVTVESSQKLRIGSDRDCDLVLKRAYILPVHCEVESHKMTHKLMRSPLADVILNDSSMHGESAVLADGDVIQLGDLVLQFKVTRQATKRHWRTDLVSYSAVGLLTVMLILESLVMFWLPSRLSSDTAWEREQALQELIETLDRTRAIARELSVKEKNDEGFIRLFVLTLDEIAKYVRSYKEVMTRSQIAELNEDLTRITPVVTKWKKTRKIYTKEETLDLSRHVKDLILKFENASPIKNSSGVSAP